LNQSDEYLHIHRTHFLAALLSPRASEIRQEREDAYRRGFHQGYEAALRHIKSGRTVAELNDHADRLESWRMAGRRNLGPHDPPDLRRDD
jgi:flagellar biosynthesis/type III secretory pathway protein FliH